MLPSQLSILDRFQLARDTGFEQTEIGTTDDDRQAEEMLAASKKTGIRIHSVMNRDHWRYPLSSRDPEVVAKSVAGMKTSFRNASLWGADGLQNALAGIGCVAGDDHAGQARA